MNGAHNDILIVRSFLPFSEERVQSTITRLPLMARCSQRIAAC